MTPEVIRLRLADGESLCDLELEADAADQRPSFIDEFCDRIVSRLVGEPEDKERRDEGA